MYLPVEHGTPAGSNRLRGHNQHDHLRASLGTRLFGWRLPGLPFHLNRDRLSDRSSGHPDHQLVGRGSVEADFFLSLRGYLSAVQKHGVLLA
jgi:hypothetical protein